MLYAVAGILLLLIGLCITGVVITNTIYHPRHFTWEQGKEHDRENGVWIDGEFEARPIERFSIKSFDGTLLNAAWLMNETPSNKAVVIMHGFGCCAVNSYKYAKLFLARGYNALIYDNRNAGESEGKRTTLGYMEQHDLHLMVDIAVERMGKNGIVCTHGESQGGATVLLEACHDNRLAFVIADCPFSNMAEQVAYSVKRMAKLPRWPFVPFASLISKLRAGFFFSEASPLRELEAACGLPDMPILFIHGTADTFILPYHTQRLYDAKRGKKMLWYCQGATHARSICKAPQEYERVLDEFLYLVKNADALGNNTVNK
ncbi:MAG: alpha/beta hydrolase [Clostridia bacterium]